MNWLKKGIGWVINKAENLLGLAEDVAGMVAVASAVLFHSRDLRSFLSKSNPLVANFLGKHSEALGELQARAQDLATNTLADETLAAADLAADATDLASLTRAAADLEAHPAKVAIEFDAKRPSMSALAAKAEALLQDGIKGMLSLYTDELQSRRSELPGGVNDVAAGMVSKALKYGLTAQLAALAVEAVYVTKYTGLNQLVGYLANFAGFDRITGPLIGPQLKHGLAVPAEHQAAKLFRTRLPAARDVQEQTVQRHTTKADYRRALQLEGYPEDWINVLVDDVYVDPRPREIITLLEGVDADPQWVLEKYREVGWDDADVKRAVEATMRRVRRPAAERYLRTLSTSYLNGYRTLDQVEAGIRNVSRDDAYVELWRRALEEEKAHRNAEQMAAAIVSQFEKDVLGNDATEELLEALGFDAAEVTRRRVVAQLRRNEALLRGDVAEVEQLARQIRTQALTTLRAEVRAGRLTAADFVTLGKMLGYADTFLSAIADLEELKAPPREVRAVSTAGLEQLAPELLDLGEPPTDDKGKPLAAWTDLQQAAMANLRAQLRAGMLPRADFVGLGQMLGLDPLTLEQLADVELLRATPSLEDPNDATPASLAAAAHAALTDLAADLVERRVLAASSALALLQEAGVPVEPATVAIAIAEVLAGETDELTVWPFQTLGDNTLVWTSIASSVAGALRDAGGASGPLADLLGIVSRAQPAVVGAKRFRDNLRDIFGSRKPRKREKVATERPAAPAPLEVPTEAPFVPTGPTGGGVGGPTGIGPEGPDTLV